MMYAGNTFSYENEVEADVRTANGENEHRYPEQCEKSPKFVAAGGDICKIEVGRSWSEGNHGP
jgi:hypothetical protein